MMFANGKRNCLLFVLIIFLGLLYLSSTVHIWNDEHVFNRFSWTFNNFGLNRFIHIFYYSSGSLHPPFYLFFLYIYSKTIAFFTFPTFLILRIPSVIFSTFSFYYILKELKFKTKYLLPLSLIILLQVQNFYYWFDLGPYPIVFLLSTLYITKLEKFWNSPNYQNKDILFLVLNILVLSYTHYFGVILIFSCGMIYIIRSYHYKNKFNIYFLTHLIGFILFLPWLIFALKKITSQDAPGSLLPNQEEIHYIYDFLKMLTALSGNSLILLFFSVFIIFAAYKKRMNLLLSFLLFLIITNIRSFIIFPLFVARYNYPILPIFFILFCLGLNELAKTKKMITLYFFVFLINIPYHQDYIDSLSARWLNPPYHLSLVDTYIKEHPSQKRYSFYVGLNSHLDLEPYIDVIDITKLNLFPIGTSCDLTDVELPAIYLSNDLFCLPEVFIEDGFELLDDKYGSSLWVKQ